MILHLQFSFIIFYIKMWIVLLCLLTTGQEVMWLDKSDFYHDQVVECKEVDLWVYLFCDEWEE